jgi:hypothetical protein
MKLFLPIVLVAALVFGGCSGKNSDAAKIADAGKAIDAGEFEKGVALLDALGKDNPGDPAVKKARVDGYMKYANHLMFASNLPPKQKYSTALKMYRNVVALDPTNEEAKKNAGMIEGIYTQMGRPIPQ